MSVCVRYTVGLNVVERFLGFVDVSENQNAESLCAKIFEFLTENQLDKYHIVAQSYDGASVMSGKFNGVQSKVKNKFPYAIYTHCMAHRMNLVVIDMCKIVKVIKYNTTFYFLGTFLFFSKSFLFFRKLELFLTQ